MSMVLVWGMALGMRHGGIAVRENDSDVTFKIPQSDEVIPTRRS
jgi:hypothetical protein